MSSTPLAPADGSASESETEESPLTQSPAGGGTASSAAAGTTGYVADFLALPTMVFVMFFLEFLNSYRNFGLRFVQYQYINNEFGLDDVQTGSLLGVKSTMDIIFGILGSLLTDAIGVKKTATAALCSPNPAPRPLRLALEEHIRSANACVWGLAVALIGRGIFVLGRSPTALWIASTTFSPFGEAVLGTGIYTVALKKLTPPRLRPLAFAVQYASFNFSGALCDAVIDVSCRTKPPLSSRATVVSRSLDSPRTDPSRRQDHSIFSLDAGG